MIKHLDLFSGIGGFAYAIDEIFGDAEHVFVEFDPFCQQVLKKHWPEAKIYGDIRQIDSNPFNERLEGIKQKESSRQPRQSDRAGKDETSRPFILTGGFPCQPFSAAGLRRGTADERHLWPEMLRVIRFTQPEWVIAENVRGILTWNDGLVFEQVCLDLEAADYEVQPFIIPAVAVNAPHRRDRVWFVGYAKHDGLNGAENPQSSIKRTNGNSAGSDKLRQPQRTDSLRPTVTDTRCEHGGAGSGQIPFQQTAKRSLPTKDIKRSGNYAGNANVGRLERAGAKQQAGWLGQANSAPDWNRHWSEIAAELCGVDDGLSAELGEFNLSKAQHRKEQLKAYGNAIVPQVAIQILRGIKEESEDRHG